MKKFNPDASQKDDLLELSQQDGYDILLDMIDSIINKLEAEVLNFDLSKPFSSLAMLKAKLDGAKHVRKRIDIELNNIFSSLK